MPAIILNSSPATWGALPLPAIGQIRNLDRRHIRERFDERFTARRMAEEYVASYRMLISMSQSQTATKGKRTGASTRSEAVSLVGDSQKLLHEQS
jgi:hypothetical protein